MRGWLCWHAGELFVVIVLAAAATRVPWLAVAAGCAALWVAVQEIRVRSRVAGRE